MKTPVTMATRALKARNILYDPFQYQYQEKGGTAVSAKALGVPEQEIIKTLVFKDDEGRPFIILMNGDKEVSAKQLARHLGVKSVGPCTTEEAQKHSGYQVGGTSPFGFKKNLRIYVEQRIFRLEHLFINGGKRGFLVRITPSSLKLMLQLEPVQVGV